MSKSNDARSHRSRLGTVVLAVAVVVSGCAMFALAPVGGVHAAAPAKPETGGMIWQKGGCSNCHGNLAAGDGDSAYPTGPNLRLTGLNHDQLIMTISCGRPKTPMPYNLATAYTQTQCNGMPLGAPPSDVNRGAGFTAAQIATLVDFLTANVVGKTNITRENCAAFFDGDANSPLCQQY
jgi:mono/diheme cytochrome c family protein